VGPRASLNGEENVLPCQESNPDSWVVHSMASHYIDLAIPNTHYYLVYINMSFLCFLLLCFLFLTVDLTEINKKYHDIYSILLLTRQAAAAGEDNNSHTTMSRFLQPVPKV
jgi:hypothetical protein